MSHQPDCVITLRPQNGKYAELQSFVFEAMKEIRENVSGIVHAYPFEVSGKEEIIVLERFVSEAAMFKYFNSDYHAGLVEKLLPVAQEPIDIRSSANVAEMQEWKDNTPGTFTV